MARPSPALACITMVQVRPPLGLIILSRAQAPLCCVPVVVLTLELCRTRPLSAQVVCSLSIIAITSNRITHPGFGTQRRCYLSADPHNTSPCTFAYAAAGVSLATAALAACLKVGVFGAIVGCIIRQ